MILEKDGLRLISSQVSFAEPLVEYYKRNREFLKPYEPEHDEIFYLQGFHELAISKEMEAEKRGENIRFYIHSLQEPDKIIGTISLNNIIRGIFQSCFLGYKLDKEYLNTGCMTQAISMVTEYAFKELKLHRIEANVMPWNKASLRVLEKNGYEYEGLAKAYLKINGVWENHVHMVKLNRDEI